MFSNCMSRSSEIVLCNVYRITVVVYLECSTPWLCSACLGSNRPTATDYFVWGPMLMNLEVNSYISITYTAKFFNGGNRAIYSPTLVDS